MSNKEYLSMMYCVAALLSIEEAISKLGVGSIFILFKAFSLQLEELMNGTIASAETQDMSETDTQRDSYLSYLLSSIRTAKNLPLAAHIRLEIVSVLTRNWHKCAIEGTVAIRGLLLDLPEEANAADIASLGLTDIVVAQKGTNDHYAEPTDRSG